MPGVWLGPPWPAQLGIHDQIDHPARWLSITCQFYYRILFLGGLQLAGENICETRCFFFGAQWLGYLECIVTGFFLILFFCLGLVSLLLSCLMSRELGLSDQPCQLSGEFVIRGPSPKRAFVVLTFDLRGRLELCCPALACYLCSKDLCFFYFLASLVKS